MRISTAHAFKATTDSLARRHSEMTEAQQKLISGKRVERASDDPIAAARAERALASEARSQASQRAADASRSAMTQSEGALGDAVELLQQAREALVAGGNASFSDTQRLALAEQIRGIRKQLLGIANRGDGSGGYLFGGQGAAEPPFLDVPGGVQFRGSGGQIEAAAGEPLPLSVDGARTWLQAPSGNGVFVTQPLGSGGGAWIDSGRVTNPQALSGATYTLQFSVAAGATTYSVLKDGAATPLSNVAYSAGQAIEIDGMAFTVSGTPVAGEQFEAAPSTPSLSVFDTLDRAANALATQLRPQAEITQSTQSGLRDIDAVLGRLQVVRSEVGEAMKRIDSTTSRLQATELEARTERSSAEDLDMVEAISDFQNQQTGYDAALKTYSIVQRMSLFQYING